MGPPILATRDANPVRSQLARAFEPGSRDTTIAFRVTDRQFQDFLGDLGDHDLSHEAGRRLTSGDVVVDHDLSWSLCFLDPEGNRLEVTTRDYESVRSAI